ncbi:MAG: hypothetical protein Q8R29_02910 [bacterium]|nr:hypothetical protein [bacterium]
MVDKKDLHKEEPEEETEKEDLEKKEDDPVEKEEKKEGAKTSPAELILKRLKKSSWSIPEIAAEFDTSEEEAVRLVDELYRRGHEIVHDRETKKVSLSSDPTQMEALKVSLRRNGEILRHVRKFGVIHGTVLGSRFSNPSLLHTVKAMFAEDELDFVIHLGDITAGQLPPKRAGELFLPTDPEVQANYVLQHYPVSNRFKTYVISGTRDLAFKAARRAAVNVVRRICADESRSDLVYRGDLSTTLQVRKVRIEVINPGEDYAPYTKSYPLQNILTNLITERSTLAPSEEEDAVIVLLGGSHVYDHTKQGGTYGVLVPSLQSLTPYQKSKRKRGFAPFVGALIVELYFDEKWRLKKDKGRDGVKIRPIQLKKYARRDDYKAPVQVKTELSELAGKMLKSLDDSPKTEGELSRNFKINKRKVWEIIEELQKHGYQIVTPKDETDTKQFVLQHKMATSFQPLDLKKIFVHRHKAGFTSDCHFGSFDQLYSCVTKLYEVFDEEEVGVVFHCGDWTAGDFDHPANRHKVFIPSTEGQMRFLTDWYPKSKRGIITEGIGGDHDSQHGGRKGLDVLRAMFAPNRPDIKYLGSLIGKTKLGDMNVVLLHPDGGAGYGLSYKSQNIAESETRLSITRGESLHILALGHLHIFNVHVHGEVIVISVPCLQAQTQDYMRRKGLDPWVGGLVCEFVTDSDGYVTMFSTQCVDMNDIVKTPDFPVIPLNDFFEKYALLK